MSMLRQLLLLLGVVAERGECLVCSAWGVSCCSHQRTHPPHMSSEDLSNLQIPSSVSKADLLREEGRRRVEERASVNARVEADLRRIKKCVCTAPQAPSPPPQSDHHSQLAETRPSTRTKLLGRFFVAALILGSGSGSQPRPPKLCRGFGSAYGG